MPINFLDERNKDSYLGRKADEGWETCMRSIVDPTGLYVLDVGCGGGIYSQGWLNAGARRVTGIDSSEVMVAAARQHLGDTDRLSFTLGSADKTGQLDASADVVFERALIHHLTNLRSCFEEVFRVLKPGGKLIIQDRTPEDALLEGSREHIRGYFFEVFKRLADVEISRRPREHTVCDELLAAGFSKIQTVKLWETRKTYASWGELERDLMERKGRSILHELNDQELKQLTAFIGSNMNKTGAIIERDRWTIWSAVKPV